MADLPQASELRELGTATFLARPLGCRKRPGEVDRTPLVGYEAYSRMLARQRLAQLKSAGWLTADGYQSRLQELNALKVIGVSADSLQTAERPGVVSLADLAKAGPDFVLVRSTRRSLDTLFAAYDLAPLARAAPSAFELLTGSSPRLLVPAGTTGSAAATLRVYDSQARPRLELALETGAPGSSPYCERAGSEWAPRLKVVRAWEASGEGEAAPHDFAAEPIWLELRP
jgi:hypothetical protein